MKSLVYTNQTQRAVSKYKKSHHVDGVIHHSLYIVLVMANLNAK